VRYYISDLHFFHEGILNRMDNRGFESIEAMHDYMIKQWNSKVRAGDEVVILGDFSFGGTKETMDILQQLKGKKFLITGNHDKWLKKYDNEKQHYFNWIKPYAELNDNKRKVILCHYPVFCYNGQFKKNDSGEYTTWMLHGHIHVSDDVYLVEKYKEITKQQTRTQYHGEVINTPIQMINCFCMFSDYIPLTLDEWIEKENNGECKSVNKDWAKG